MGRLSLPTTQSGCTCPSPWKAEQLEIWFGHIRCVFISSDLLRLPNFNLDPLKVFVLFKHVDGTEVFYTADVQAGGKYLVDVVSCFLSFSGLSLLSTELFAFHSQTFIARFASFLGRIRIGCSRWSVAMLIQLSESCQGLQRFRRTVRQIHCLPHCWRSHHKNTTELAIREWIVIIYHLPLCHRYLLQCGLVIEFLGGFHANSSVNRTRSCAEIPTSQLWCPPGDQAHVPSARKETSSSCLRCLHIYLSVSTVAAPWTGKSILLYHS